MYKIGLCILDNNNKVVSVKLLKTCFTKEVKDDMKSLYALDLKSEFSELLFSEIKNNLKKNDVSELLEGIK